MDQFLDIARDRLDMLTGSADPWVLAIGVIVVLLLIRLILSAFGVIFRLTLVALFAVAVWFGVIATDRQDDLVRGVRDIEAVHRMVDEVNKLIGR